ncbi:hypothetical protein [Deinococcus sp. RIT780]|uniref:hypothetical protein n=1 Tax=Deinococcus sp. RIT780 TaxID=2870472 RepID=UPI001C89A487|nr:hypothetical protein [Deinococcus sp. RIT780]MBX8466155.1 hypothetical protein [Deinococcus sp. RIT780]
MSSVIFESNHRRRHAHTRRCIQRALRRRLPVIVAAGAGTGVTATLLALPPLAGVAASVSAATVLAGRVTWRAYLRHRDDLPETRPVRMP